MNAREQVDRWNERYEVGQSVRFWRSERYDLQSGQPVRDGAGEIGNTRSRAWELCGTAVVQVTGASGGIALSHVEPVVMPPLTDEDQAACEDLAVILQQAPWVRIEFPASEVFMLIGLLQLAARHPLNNGHSGQFARRLARDLAARLPEPCHELVERGWQESHDYVAVPADDSFDLDDVLELTDLEPPGGGS